MGDDGVTFTVKFPSNAPMALKPGMVLKRTVPPPNSGGSGGAGGGRPRGPRSGYRGAPLRQPAPRQYPTQQQQQQQPQQQQGGNFNRRQRGGPYQNQRAPDVEIVEQVQTIAPPPTRRQQGRRWGPRQPQQQQVNAQPQPVAQPRYQQQQRPTAPARRQNYGGGGAASYQETLPLAARARQQTQPAQARYVPVQQRPPRSASAPQQPRYAAAPVQAVDERQENNRMRMQMDSQRRRVATRSNILMQRRAAPAAPSTPIAEPQPRYQPQPQYQQVSTQDTYVNPGAPRRGGGGWRRGRGGRGRPW